MSADEQTRTKPGQRPSRVSSQAAGEEALEPGALLAKRYLLRRFIAAGGMGEVWEAEDQTLREVVALKTVRRDQLSEESRRRLQAEVKLARRLSHPHLCRVFEFGQHRIDDEQTLDFLTMELLQGQPLSERLRASGPLPVTEALVILEQLATGLDAAHAAGIVHRDLKSSNVIIEPSGQTVRAVITDFGIARDLEAVSRITVDGAQLGTPAYMSPEQVEGANVGPASDRFSFGVLAFELVTGKTPFGGDTPLSAATARLVSAPRPIATQGVPPHWDLVLSVALARTPDDRFASAAAFVAALKDPEIGGRLGRTRRRAKWAAGALALLVLVAGVATYQRVAVSPSAVDPCPEGVCKAWSGRLSGSPGQDQTESVLIEPTGAMLMAGRVTGPDDLGCGPIHVSNPGSSNGIIVGFGRTGICQWMWVGTQPHVDYVTRLFRGSAGRRFAWAGTLTPGSQPWFGPSVILEISQTGTVTQVPTQGAPESWQAAVVDRKDRVTIAAVTEGFARTAASPAGLDIVRLLADGEVAWRNHLATGTTVRAHWMEADSNGDVGIIGSFRETLELGGKPFASRGESDMFMAKVSGVDGHVMWSHVFGTAADESQDLGLASDEQGNWFGVGEHGGVDFGQGTLRPSIFVVKWSPDGEVLWSKGFGGASKRDAARRVVVDKKGNPIVFGRFLSSVVELDERTFENVAGSDLYLARLDAKSGSLLGVKTWPAVDAPARALAYDPASGNVAIGGRFNQQLTFGQALFTGDGEDGYFASVGAVP